MDMAKRGVESDHGYRGDQHDRGALKGQSNTKEPIRRLFRQLVGRLEETESLLINASLVELVTWV